jgi:hypothetical protein
MAELCLKPHNSFPQRTCITHLWTCLTYLIHSLCIFPRPLAHCLSCARIIGRPIYILEVENCQETEQSSRLRLRS